MLFLSAEFIQAEPVPEQLIGKITVAKSSSIDARARKELALIAQKIKKLRKSGSVRIVGTVSAAASQDDFIIKSVFVARNVETNLRKLLPQSFQTYVTTSKFEGLNSGGKTEVAVYLYPHELRPEGAKFISTDLDHAQPVSAPDAAQQTMERILPDKASPLPQGGLLSQPKYDNDLQQINDSKERIQVEAEDAVKAEELVNKAKARAAKKAKQLETE
jgi:hypothetical protein